MERIYAYVERELLEWLEDQVREGRYSSISEAVRECVRLGMYSAPIEWEKLVREDKK